MRVDDRELGSALQCPRVVACLPAWQAAEFIGPVLESLAAQTYPNVEVLISVDVCSDETAEICERFAESHPNARVIRQPERLGWIANTNALLSAANGDFAFFAFHDDPLEPTYVARLVEALERNPEAVLAYSDFYTHAGIRTYEVLEGADKRFERCRRVLHGYGAWWVPNRGLMRIGAVKALGGMRAHLGGEYAADWPWLLRLATLGAFVRVPEPLLFKNLRAKSLSKSWRANPRKRIGLQLARMQAIREARFPLPQELYLHAESLIFALGLRAGPQWLRDLNGKVRMQFTPGDQR